MTPSDQTLTLAQILSPSFPVGAFAYSHGLESAVQTGRIATAAGLQDWLDDLLRHGSARSDAVLVTLACAAEGTAALAALDAIARAFAPSAERLQETDLQGAAFCQTLNTVWDLALPPLCYPVAVGAAARALDLDPTLTTAMYLHAFIGNLTGAAMRLGVMGQTDGQRVQTALKPICLTVAQDLSGATLDDLHSASFVSDILSMHHETEYSRVFRT